MWGRCEGSTLGNQGHSRKKNPSFFSICVWYGGPYTWVSHLWVSPLKSVSDWSLRKLCNIEMKETSRFQGPDRWKSAPVQGWNSWTVTLHLKLTPYCDKNLRIRVRPLSVAIDPIPWWEWHLHSTCTRSKKPDHARFPPHWRQMKQRGSSLSTPKCTPFISQDCSVINNSWYQTAAWQQFLTELVWQTFW